MRYVSYLRVSTARQGVSGLGLEAQREAVARFLDRRGPDGTATPVVARPPASKLSKTFPDALLAEFIEVESGKSDANRPMLAEALELVEMTGATLLVAKLDRLSRDAAFILALQKKAMDGGVKFTCADMPEANEMTIGFLAIIAQHERRMISERTKAALGSVKAKLAAGEAHVSKASGRTVARLGNPNGAAALRRAGKLSTGPAVRKRKADEYAAKVRKRLGCMVPGWEAMSMVRLAAELTEAGIRAPGGEGKPWHPTAVARVLARATDGA